MAAILAIDAAWTPGQPSGVALLEQQGGAWKCLAVAPSYDQFTRQCQGEPVNWSDTPRGSAPDAGALLDASNRLTTGQRVDLVTIDMPVSRAQITQRRPADQAVSSQARKGTRIPYISHLLAVCSIVLESGGIEDEAIAALLHDAVEDQGGQPVLDEIRRRFGDNVAAIVEGCTDAYVKPKPPWKERKERYISHLDMAPPSVLLVSIADKLHNARAILSDYRKVGEALWDRFKGKRDGTLWYYRKLHTTTKELGGTSCATN